MHSTTYISQYKNIFLGQISHEAIEVIKAIEVWMLIRHIPFGIIYFAQ